MKALTLPTELRSHDETISYPFSGVLVLLIPLYLAKQWLALLTNGGSYMLICHNGSAATSTVNFAIS